MQLSDHIYGDIIIVVTVPFQTAPLLGLLFSDIRVVDCHTGVLGWSPGGPKIFSPWNYFNGGSGNSVAPESASGSGSGLYSVVVGARLSGNRRGKSV